MSIDETCSIEYSKNVALRLVSVALHLVSVERILCDNC
jgi:hypothetical protein